MRFKARFPEVFFCMRDYLKCLFLLAASFHPLWDFATDDQPGLAVRSGQSPLLGEIEGSRLPGGTLGWVRWAHRKGGLLKALQVDRSAREVLSHGRCNHFPSAQTITWEKPPHTEMES